MHKFPILGALAAMLVAVPAQAEIIEQKSDAFVVRDSVVVSASKREVWLDLISPNKWWNDAHTFSGDAINMSLMPRAGGCFCERMPGEDSKDVIGLDGSVEHMRVILSIPDQALRMRGNLGPLQSEPVNAVLTVTMSDVQDGTKIVFEYAVGGYMRFETPPIAKAVDGVITQQMMGLAKGLGLVDAPEVEPEVKDEVSEEEADADEVDDGDDEPEGDEESKTSVDEAFGDLTIDE